jgi:hypothetical protein
MIIFLKNTYFSLKKLICHHNLYKNNQYNLFKRFFLMAIFIFSSNSKAWDAIHTLPLINEYSYLDEQKIKKNYNTIIVTYINEKNKLWSLPIKRMKPNTDVLIKVLLPPGIVLSTLFAQSGWWDGLYASEFDSEHCDEKTLCDKNKLTLLKDGFNPTLYGHPKKMAPSFALQKAKYKYIHLKWKGSNFFSFSSIQIQMKISDYALYTQWRNQRPWAGGDVENSIDGVDHADEKDSVDDKVEKPAMRLSIEHEKIEK